MKASTLASSPDTRTAPGASARWEGLGADDLLRAYRTMLLSRRIDDKEIQLKNQSLIFFQISGAGHEAVLTAAGMHLRAGYDWFYPYYRDRALCLTLGMTSLEMLLAAVGAKDDPNSGGRQMPSHWGHKKLNIPSQGSPDRHAVPAGRRRRRSRHDLRAHHGIADRHERFHADEITYISIGEGATSEGEFWESLNTACTRSVPVLYLVEDNGYAISVPVEVQTPGGDVSRLVETFPNLKLLRCDGTDFLDSYRTLGEAAAYVRRERKPAFVHAKVIRPYSHSLSDDERLYKTPEERKAEALRDPLTKMRAFLLQETDRHRRRSRRRARSRSIARSPRPPSSRSRRRSRRSIPPHRSCSRRRSIRHRAQFVTSAQPEGKPDTMVGAINRTMKDEMAKNPRIVVFGEDVADASKASALAHVPGKGGVFKVTHGLQKAYGADRVFNSPLAEANIVGRAVGMATRGLKPVVEIQFFDYIWPAMMQLKDEMSMLRYRSGNNWSCPMVVRVPIGGYLRGGAPYHSQSGVSIFAHCPGDAHRVPEQRRRRRGPAAHGDSLRRSGALSRAQAPLPPDLQQGRLSRPGLHDSVRQGLAPPRRHRHGGADVGRAGAALAAGRPAGGERRHQRRGVRPAHDHAVRLGRHRQPRAEHEQSDRGARRHA